jgi:hypothetical protein
MARGRSGQAASAPAGGSVTYAATTRANRGQVQVTRAAGERPRAMWLVLTRRRPTTPGPIARLVAAELPIGVGTDD